MHPRRRHKSHRPRTHGLPLPRSSWVTVSALVASAAFGTKLATPVAAADLDILTRDREDVVRLVLSAPADLRFQQAPAAAPVQTPVSFNIPEGPVTAALAAFTAATGIQIETNVPTLQGLTSPGVSGVFTPSEALTRILEGTGHTSRFSTAAVAVIELRVASEMVDVAAASAHVESTKYSTPLSQIPQTIQVIPHYLIEQQGATTLTETLRNVPGITIQAGEGGGASSTTGDMFNLRGFSANNSVFIDGVRDDGLISRDTFNIEQVEVFFGPTGSDVGRGTAGGYVNMVTKTPRLASAVEGNYSYGSADHQRITIDANQDLPMGEPGSWVRGTAVRLNALFQNGGVPGRDEVETERKAVAPSIGLGIGTPTRVTMAGQFMRQDNVPDYGIPAAAWTEPLNLATPNVIAPQSVDQSNYYGNLDFDYDQVSQDSVLARIEHDVNTNLSFRNQSRYNKTHRAAVITSIGGAATFNPDAGTISLLRQGNERENEIFANQTSLSLRAATGMLRHAINAGFEVISEDQFAPTLTGVGTPGVANIYSPDHHTPVTDYAVGRTGAYTDGSTDTVGAYVFDVVSLGGGWQASGGVRVERYDTKFLSVDATGAATTDASADGTVASGKAGLLYQFRPDANVYISYGTTVTPPGTANFTLSTQANNQNNPNVDPQRSTNFEVGTKWDVFEGRLSSTFAAFRTKNKNVIYTVDSTAVPPIFNQDDGQLVTGFAAGVAGRVNQGWQIIANFAYLDSELETQNAANDGKRLTLTPKWSGSLWTSYTLEFPLTLGGGIRHQGDTYYNAANTLRAEGYTLIDGLVEYEVNQNLSLRLNLYNLTDETYIRNINNNGARYNPGHPRSAVFSTAVRF